MSKSEHIIFAGPADLKPLVHKYIGETEKNLILCDTNTAKHCFPIIKDFLPAFDKDRLIVIDAGDDEKNINSLNHIWSKLQFHGADRSSCLVNLGGGMVTDVGGFAASTYKRGISFINIPTSLLGMVDASIGGKTGINLSKVKNQVGSFSRANTVIIYPPFLETLPAEEHLAGYAEVLKTAIVFDRELYYDLIETMPEDLPMEEVIRKTASIKKEITARDFHDRGERQCLNFGHTIGHGLEALYLSKGQELKHGFAVAAGMVCEAYISARILKLPEQGLQQITDYIRRSFPPVRFREKDMDDIIALLRHDKKNFRNELRMSLLDGIGNCKCGITVSEEIIRDALLFYIAEP